MFWKKLFNKTKSIVEEYNPDGRLEKVTKYEKNGNLSVALYNPDGSIKKEATVKYSDYTDNLMEQFGDNN